MAERGRKKKRPGQTDLARDRRSKVGTVEIKKIEDLEELVSGR